MKILDLLKKVFCIHNWECIGSGGLWENGGRRIGNQYTYRCSKCGALETRFQYYNGGPF